MKKLLWIVMGMLVLVHTHAFSATLNFDNSASLPALKASGTCGTWNNEWSFSGSEFFCNAPVTFASGDIIRTTSSAVTIRANTGITLNNNSVGTSSNRVNLATSSGNMQISGSMVIYGNVLNGSGSGTIQGSSSASRITINGNVSSGGSLSLTNVTMTGLIQGGSSLVSLNTVNLTGSITSSGNLTLQAATVSGTINVSGSASVTNGSTVGGNITVGNGLASTGSVFNGNILSTNGNITLTGANVAGNISAPGNAITATNTDIAGTITANGDIELTDVEVGGKVTSTSNEVFGTGTVFGNGISGHSGVEVTGGSIVGDLRSGCNNIILNSTTMTSGTIQTTPTLGSGCGADRVEFNNSTINASILGGPNNVYINDTQFTGDIKARFDVELDNSTVYGNISGEPGYALHLVDLTDSAIYGNVTVNTQFGDITGNWPNSGIYGSCSYEFVTPSLCSAASPSATDAYWKFDEALWNGSANEVIDSSVNLKHGRSRNGANTAVIDPSPASCTFGDFQRGSSSSNNPHVFIGQNAYFHNADDFGFTLWLKMNSSQQSGSRQVILAYGDEDGVNEEDEGRFELLRTSAGRLRFAVRMQSEDLHYVEVNGSGIFDGQWKHIAVSYSKQNKRIRLYANNVLVSDTLNASIGNGNKDRTPNDGNTGLSIGALPDGDHGIRGQIDEVKFFAHEPTAAEIQTMYQQTASCANECFNENFTSDANWYLTQRNSTPPSLRTSPSRLRLTENTLNQATSITFKRSFPAAGNKMTIEFDHYAYGGTGADGIALVLSDAAVTPVPGSYGGSLGYAQRTNVSPSQSGFAGGWLGIGFDEYGSFSQATEGRVGGTTARPNAIGVRAASSTSYGWLGGTNTLSPALSASGSTLARGDRYRITIDSRVTSPQTVSFLLERRLAGGSTYTSLINTANLLTLGQPAPPANLLLSYTGSTGDNTNFHEITNIQVCTQQPSTPIEIGGHHIRLSYSPGLTCESNLLTVTACANATCTAPHSNLAYVDLNVTYPNSPVTTMRVNLTNGVGTVSLSNTVQGNAAIDVSGNTLQSCNGATPATSACSMYFSDTGLKISPIPNQIAGLNSPSKVRLQVIKTDTETKACIARLTPPTTVKFGYQCVDPQSCIGGEVFSVDGSAIASNPKSAVTQFTPLARNFDSADAWTDFTIKYTDVGKVRLHAKLELPAESGQPALTLQQQSNEFVVRPDQILVQSVTSSDGTVNPATTTSGLGFVAAGEDFKVVLDVVNREGDRTPNYGKEDDPEKVGLNSVLAYPVINGAACDAATTTCVPNPDVVFGTPFTPVLNVDGRFETSTAKWMQAGSIQLNGKISDDDYLGAGNTASTNPAVLVGRFYPHHFALALPATPVTDSCEAGNFSYMDASTITMQATVEAMALDGTTVLTNYNSQANKTYSDTADIGLVAENANAATDLSSRLNTVSASWNDGRWVFNSTEMNFAKLATLAPDGPYSALQLGLTVRSERDNRKFASTALDMNPNTSTNCIAAGNCSAVQVGNSLDVRYGRLALLNAAGPEDEDLPIILQSQYWNSNRFEQNLNDICTAYTATNLSVTGITSSTGGTPGVMAAGQNPYMGMFIPAPNAVGTATLRYEIPSSLDYLQFPWNGGTALTNPVAEAQFGRHQGNKRQIFWQEKLN